MAKSNLEVEQMFIQKQLVLVLNTQDTYVTLDDKIVDGLQLRRLQLESYSNAYAN